MGDYRHILKSFCVASVALVVSAVPTTSSARCFPQLAQIFSHQVTPVQKLTRALAKSTGLKHRNISETWSKAQELIGDHVQLEQIFLEPNAYQAVNSRQASKRPGTLSMASHQQIITALWMKDRAAGARAISETVTTDPELFPGHRTDPILLVPYPRSQKTEGMVFAVNDAGFELPVIDVTHQAFQVPADFLSSRARSRRSLLFLKSLRLMGENLRQPVGRNSHILHDFLVSDSTFLNGEPTYWAKLGPEYVPDPKSPGSLFDRLAANSLQSVSTLARLHSTVDLASRELVQLMTAKHNLHRKNIRLLNLGGGPSMDSLNTLIKIQKEHPGLLDGREITIHVRDFNESGPAFGERALRAFQQEGATLHGLNIQWDYKPFDWNQPAESLRFIRSESLLHHDFWIGFSEGALFEYGTGRSIQTVLDILRPSTPWDFALVGSAYWEPTKVHPTVLEMKKISDMGWKLRGLDSNNPELPGIRDLAKPVKWRIEKRDVIDANPVFGVFMLRKTSFEGGSLVPAEASP